MINDSIHLHVGTAEDIGERFVQAWHRAEQGDSTPETHLTFASLELLLAALTPKRLDLLRHVRHHPTASIKALAVELRRDYKNVHQDVQALSRVGLLRRTSHSVIAPYAQVEARFIL